MQAVSEQTEETKPAEVEEDTLSSAPGSSDRRRRGRRPADATERRRQVEWAISDLEGARVPFTMADVAERAGISRATLYRDAGLRDLVGARGDSPSKRPVDNREFERLRERAANLSEERRTLRRTVRDLEARLRAANDRLDELESRAADDASNRRSSPRMDGAAAEQIHKEAYAEGFAAGVRTASQRGTSQSRGSGAGELRAVAARLPKNTLVAARRTLARQLHPDLFAKDPAAAMLATELLKQINALIGPNG